MKRLFLLRHAKSTWDDLVARDFDRPLNEKGHRAARTMGREMRRLDLDFDAVIASPARRVIETLHEVAQGFGGAVPARLEERIYLATCDTLVDLVRATPDEVNSLMLAGHSPGLEQLILTLTGKKEKDLRAAVEEKFPTGALVELELPVARWRDVAPGQAALIRFIRPRDLDPELGPDH
jgi:phosphohistidine phosphatase